MSLSARAKVCARSRDVPRTRYAGARSGAPAERNRTVSTKTSSKPKTQKPKNPKTQKPKNVDSRASTGRGASRGQFLRLPSCARRRRRAESRGSAVSRGLRRGDPSSTDRRGASFFTRLYVRSRHRRNSAAETGRDASLFEPRARSRFRGFRDTTRSNVPIAFYSARAEGAECCDASALAKQNTRRRVVDDVAEKPRLVPEK